MGAWQYFYVEPQSSKVAGKKINNKQTTRVIQAANAIDTTASTIISSEVTHIEIMSDSLKGSIALKGLRFDDLVLIKYKQDLSDTSPAVRLLEKSDSIDSYFVDLGWFSADSTLDLPNSETLWSCDDSALTPNKPINLSWTNKYGAKFIVNIAMDDNYLLTIKQTLINNTDRSITTGIYGLINKDYNAKEKMLNILHQGPIGSINNQLQEYSYDKVKDKKNIKFANSAVDWIGITDKYWLVAFVPDKLSTYKTSFQYAKKGSRDKYQVDFVTASMEIPQGTEYSLTHHLFAGAKKVDLLDKYEKNYDIKLFDRAIDFGWFYILTKPVFNALNFFYKYTHNFGVSILIVTIIIKMLMFSLANKSYKSMKKMKDMQPEVERIKSLHGDDKMRLNQEIMQLYKREKINPISGCLPLILQIPVFFSIYKVLYVTIEMRQAPFFGWIKDLSAPDPTNIFNLFGLIPFDPPSFLNIGAWPIIMALTMFLQQQMSPPPADPVQAQVMKFMPLFFLIMFSSFPAGLLIYWSWNNILSIIQQYSINKLSRD
jgi:YidC/Oxa1 family membrane protein insertase